MPRQGETQKALDYAARRVEHPIESKLVPDRYGSGPFVKAADAARVLFRFDVNLI